MGKNLNVHKSSGVLDIPEAESSVTSEENDFFEKNFSRRDDKKKRF
jgi:hypothetical protein